MTRDRWCVTLDMWTVTHSLRWTFSQNFSSLVESLQLSTRESPALPVCDWQCLEYIWTKGWLTQSLNQGHGLDSLGSLNHSFKLADNIEHVCLVSKCHNFYKSILSDQQIYPQRNVWNQYLQTFSTFFQTQTGLLFPCHHILLKCIYFFSKCTLI